MNQPARAYPLRPVNEPSVYVAGDKLGQKVYTSGVNPMHGGSGPGPMPPATIGIGMNFNQQQAMLAQQNSTMEALERRRERERERERAAQRTDPRAGVSIFSGRYYLFPVLTVITADQRPPQQRVVEDEDSGGKYQGLVSHEAEKTDLNSGS